MSHQQKPEGMRMDSNVLRGLIASELPGLVALRRDLHAHPELRYEEFRTSRVVAAELAAAGLGVTAGLGGGTGVLGHLPGQGAKAVALRADMDALPIKEETGVAYASECPGVMHACGHDGHTAILVGAARVLAKISKSGALPRPVTFVFQPAEEGGAGAKKMIDDGCLSGKHTGAPVERIFGLHGWPELPLGVVSTRIGPLLASSDMFQITVTGKGGHGAFPHFTRDPIPAGAAIVGALQTIASRNVSPMESVVISVTQFHAGSANNIIPEQAVLSGTVRAFNPQVRALVKARMHEIVELTGKAMGCQSKVDYHEGYPVTFNHESAVEMVNSIAREAVGAGKVVPQVHPLTGSEDFAYYGQVVPACFFLLGILPEGKDVMPALHNPGFNFNDDAIATGVEMFCRLAMG
jgi:amidohydrolase